MQEGSKIFHSLHGIGTVESVEEKIVLGQPTRFSISSFGDDGLKIMINLDRKDNMVRPLIERTEIPKVLEHMEKWVSDLPSKAPTRYSTNLSKLKTGSIYSLCEVIGRTGSMSTACASRTHAKSWMSSPHSLGRQKPGWLPHSAAPTIALESSESPNWICTGPIGAGSKQCAAVSTSRWSIR